MQHAHAPPAAHDADTSSSRSLLEASIPTLDAAMRGLPSSPGFVALLAAYRATGGTARGDDVARLLEDHRLGDFVSLAELIASRRVFGFEWRRTLWIPMFQFDLADLSVKPATGQVLQALGVPFDGWCRAAWFARPNAWLRGRTPVDLIADRLPDVLEAARTER
jgi:hypothetical protein